MQIRPFEPSDWAELWAILEPIFRAGTTYALDRDIPETSVREFWTGPDREAWIALQNGEVVGSYMLRQNHSGGGSHVCNCGYVTSATHRGKGIASRLCEHSQHQAMAAGYSAMQFNFVVATNEGAIRLWKKLGFDVVGRLPKAFNHPHRGLVDALVMFKWLTS